MIKLIIQESVLEITTFQLLKVVLINGANLCMDGLVQITWWSAKWNNILDDLMHLYIFLSITLREGGKFTIDTATCCLFRLIKLQSGECLFRFLVESSFFLHTPSAREPSVVFETVFFSRYSPSSFYSSHILGGDLFLKNLSSISVSNLYNKLGWTMQTSHLQKIC